MSGTRRTAASWRGSPAALAAALALACTARAPPRPTDGGDAGVSGAGAGPPAAAAATTSVLEHHGGPRRDGVYVDPGLTRAAAASLRLDPAFRPAVAGAVYAQPLFVANGPGGRAVVVVATEANVVAAVDAFSGAVAWQRTLGVPVPVSRLGCGNVDPVGVTGTPVVDAGARTLYLDAMSLPPGGGPRHQVFALSLDDGTTRPGWPVDVAAVANAPGAPPFDAAYQNQRGALALVNGTLYVPFGGHWGDCGDYRGWVIAVPVGQPSAASAWATAGRGGGIWAPGGLSSDGASIFAATGNTFGASAWAGGEALLRFAAGSLAAGPADAFAPADWRRLDEGDTDLGGSGPLVIDLPGATPPRLLVGLGKDGKAYLVDRDHLGGVGGQVVAEPVSSSGIITAAAAYTTARGTHVVFKGRGARCPAGQSGDLTAVRLEPGAPPRIVTAWCAAQHGLGSPMVTTTDGHAEAIVWSVGAEGDGRLRGFDGDTGAVVFDGGGIALGPVRRFQTPIAAGGRIYVAIDGGLRAFLPP